MEICLDTDFLINFLRNGQKEILFIQENEEKNTLGTTYINLFELYYGAYKSSRKQENLKAITSLIDRLEILNFSNESCQNAGELMAKLEKSGRPIDFRDLFIGTICLTNGYSLKTGNIKHFSRINGLRVL